MMSEWTSVKNKLPPKDQEVLIYYDGFICTGYNTNDPDDIERQYWINSEIGCDLPVTHWMPLPESPNDENKQ